MILLIKIRLIFYPSPEFFTTGTTMGHQISNIWQNGDSCCPWPNYCYFLANNFFVMFFGPFLRVNNFTLKVLLTRKSGFIGCFIRIVTSATKQYVATVSVNFREDFEIRTLVFFSNACTIGLIYIWMDFNSHWILSYAWKVFNIQIIYLVRDIKPPNN